LKINQDNQSSILIIAMMRMHDKVVVYIAIYNV